MTRPALSNTAPVILGMVRQGVRTGYEIKQFVDKSTRFFWAASYGQIYPELKRLEKDGLLRGQAEPGDPRGRTSYELTPAGEQALVEWIRSSGHPAHELRDEGLLKLFFADAVSDEDAIALLRAKRAYHEGVVERLREIEPGAVRGDRGRFPPIVLRYGIGFHTWIADWCRTAEAELASGVAGAAGS
jgi:DNA-binding PadR family transcriptional regulator